jgi:hypothetical protein
MILLNSVDIILPLNDHLLFRIVVVSFFGMHLQGNIWLARRYVLKDQDERSNRRY